MRAQHKKVTCTNLHDNISDLNVPTMENDTQGNLDHMNH